MTADDVKEVSRHVENAHPGLAVALSRSGYSVDVNASKLDGKNACDLMDALVASIGREGRDLDVWMCMGDRIIHITEKEQSQ